MSDSTSLNPIPAGRRGARANDREERLTVLDPTPPAPSDPDKPNNAGVGIEGTPGNFHVARPSADVVRSAVSADPPPPNALVQYFRYVGEKTRQFKMPTGAGRDGYTARINPGKVLSTKDYPLAALKSQGFIPQKDGKGGNLEPISADEALAS